MLDFNQKPWLKSYIEFNTQQRKLAMSSFEKDFLKLLNNAVFGKTMENLRNRVDVQLVQDNRKAEKLLTSTAFHAFNALYKDLATVERTKTLKFNRPIYCGFSVLELSKLLMYEFRYNYIKHKCGDWAKLLFTDTVSLCNEIETEDVYVDMSKQMELFGTSEYADNHPLYKETNTKKIGKMKDESNGVPISEFVEVSAKMYSITAV